VYVCDGTAIAHCSFCELTICTACEGAHGGSEEKEGASACFCKNVPTLSQEFSWNLMCVTMKFTLKSK
jgi:hypothetical protein